MAHEIPIFDIGSLKAAADLSSYQYHGVYLSAQDTVNLSTSSGGECIGILQNKPAAAGHSAQVRIHGVSQGIFGATVAAGARVMCDTGGHFITATTGLKYIGRAIEGGAVTQRGSILMEHGYVP